MNFSKRLAPRPEFRVDGAFEDGLILLNNGNVVYSSQVMVTQPAYNRVMRPGFRYRPMAPGYVRPSRYVPYLSPYPINGQLRPVRPRPHFGW